MAKVASQYKITTKYGWQKGYPLHTSPYDPAVPLSQRRKYPGRGYGFHRGVDRVMPIGTAIIVNKTKIGESGNTGASTGAHLHIGRFRFGTSLDPGSTGFSLGSVGSRHPKVLDTGYDADNGNYVRIRNWYGDVFVYCHLNKVSVKAGQRIS